MKYSFAQIAEKLEDPFWELAVLGKIRLNTLTLSMDKLAELPYPIHIRKWEKEDDGTTIFYQYLPSEIGEIFVAATERGLCYLGFLTKGKDFPLQDAKKRFSKNPFEEKPTTHSIAAQKFCNGDFGQEVYLHLKGTEFQLKVWERLAHIPIGVLSTYALLVGDPKTARASGTAVGDNPVSFILPCHRIIRSDGSFKGFFWGTEMKRQLLAWELQME